MSYAKKTGNFVCLVKKLEELLIQTYNIIFVRAITSAAITLHNDVKFYLLVPTLVMCVISVCLLLCCVLPLTIYLEYLNISHKSNRHSFTWSGTQKIC